MSCPTNIIFYKDGNKIAYINTNLGWIPMEINAENVKSKVLEAIGEVCKLNEHDISKEYRPDFLKAKNMINDDNWDEVSIIGEHFTREILGI